MRDHEAAAVAGRLEDLFERIGDLRGAAGDGVGVAGGVAQPMLEEVLARDRRVLADREGELMHEAHRRCMLGGDRGIHLAEREALGQGGEIKAGIMRQESAGRLRRNGGEQPFLVELGRFRRLAHHHQHVPENADGFGIASLRAQRRVEFLALLHLKLERLAGAEHVIGKIGRGLDPARRAAGLDQHRPALRRRHGVERPAHLEVLPVVVDAAHLARIADHAALVVPDEGVGRDAVPQRAADIDELLHALVAVAVVHQAVEAVVGRVRQSGRRDDVERNPPAGEDVERVEQACRVVRVHEGRGIGEPEADMLGDARHRRDPWAHVLPRPHDAPAHRLLMRAAPGVRDAGAVAEEDHLDAAALGDAGDLLVHAHVGELRAHPGAGHAPASAHVRPRQVEGEVHVLFGHLLPLDGVIEEEDRRGCRQAMDMPASTRRRSVARCPPRAIRNRASGPQSRSALAAICIGS